MPPCGHGRASASGLCEHDPFRVAALPTLNSVPLDPDAARELSRAARMAQTWRENRDRLIRQAHADGAGLREIARLVGLTHPAISKIIGKGGNDD